MSRSDRWTGRVESAGSRSLETSGYRRAKANDYSHSPTSGSRLSQRRLQELAGLLGPRDRIVLDALGAVRVLSGSQLERLAFDEIAPSARGRIRRRVLGRLIECGLVVTLDRRVGGVRAGSSGLVYALSAAGQRLLDIESGTGANRRRQPHTPGALFLAHALAISEVYVGLVEAARRTPGLRIERFAVESAARWTPPEPGGQALRPDALVVLGFQDIEDVWWLEVDRSTESLPRLNGMLHRYFEFAGSGSVGPGGVVPRVLISVPDAPSSSGPRRTDPPATAPGRRAVRRRAGGDGGAAPGGRASERGGRKTAVGQERRGPLKGGHRLPVRALSIPHDELLDRPTNGRGTIDLQR